MRGDLAEVTKRRHSSDSHSGMFRCTGRGY
jgi:hypothetical protein